MSSSRNHLLEMLQQPRPKRWPGGFVADVEVYETMLDIAGADQVTEQQTANALYWLFRLQGYGDLEKLFG